MAFKPYKILAIKDIPLSSSQFAGTNKNTTLKAGKVATIVDKATNGGVKNTTVYYKIEAAGLSGLWFTSDHEKQGVTYTIDQSRISKVENKAQSSALAKAEESVRAKELEGQAVDNSISFNETKMAYEKAYEQIKKQKSDGDLTDTAIEVIDRYGFIHGQPFQFTPTTDRRNVGAGGKANYYGRSYANKILMNSPLVTFIPCVPRFGGDASKEDAKTMALMFAKMGKVENNDGLLDAITAQLKAKNLQYFTTSSRLREYYYYVDSIARTMALAMGIGDEKINNRQCKNISWYPGDAGNGVFDTKNMKDVFGVDQGVSFLFDPNSAITDNFSNSTRESQMTSIMKSASDKVREADFLFGVGAGGELEKVGDSDLEQMLDLGKIKNSNPNGMLNRLKGLYGTVSTGANVRFPEIWGDSQYSKPYSIDLHLYSPYGDPISKWLHVGVPFAHVLALGGPRSVTNNSYTAPFLLKAYSKGYFNCEMGIIDNISFKKFGDGDSMGYDIVSTEMDITVSFRDLYSALSISRAKDMNLFYGNSGLMELIGTICGVNMARTDLRSRIEMLSSGLFQKFIEAPGAWLQKVRESSVDNLDPMTKALINSFATSMNNKIGNLD